MENKNKGACPHCENHCKEDEIKCRRGADYFGGGEHERHDVRFDYENASTEEKIVTSLRKCGHYLHHRGHGGENGGAEFLNALTDGEKQALLAILEKIAENL